MPSFNVEVTTDVEVEFEIFCESCGAGLCHLATGRNSHGRGHPQITVEPCPTCLEAAKEEGSGNSENLQSQVDSLTEEIEEMSREMDEMRAELESLRAGSA